MYYVDGSPVDANGRISVCPVCQNTEFSEGANYCRICGTSRRNLCMPEFDQAPEHENPSNARYCEYCGAPTVFFHLKLLKPWDKVSAEMKKEALDSEPASGFTAVETDELPF